MLISETHALSTVQCVECNVDLYKILAGSTNSLGQDENQQLRQVARIVTHPKYDERNHQNDISIFTVGIKFHFNKWIQPIKLPSHGAIAIPKIEATISGWGLRDDNKPCEILRFADVLVMNDAMCSKVYEETYWKPGMLCAGPKKELSGSCYGDEGGPLVHNKTVIGLYSWSNKCGSRDLPSVFTRISYYVHWIEGIVNDK